MLNPVWTPDAMRTISYAQSAQTRGGRAFIRTVENLTGRKKLLRRARGYADDMRAGQDFWATMVTRYGLSLEIVQGSLANIPANGPVIVLANHPFGILDGLMMGHILRQTRGDFRILANSVFQQAEELQQALLPVSFDDTKAAVALNLRTRKAALAHLGQGGAIGVFPAGGVSTSMHPFARALDPGWRTFTARMIAKSRPTVVPLFFEGENSRLWQIASHVHSSLRLGLLIKEFAQRVDGPVKVHIGSPIDEGAISDRLGDVKSLMAFLRDKTYELSPNPVAPGAAGLEF